MIRRIRRKLPWFGAVAALLLLALPAQADGIEPEPDAEAEAEADVNRDFFNPAFDLFFIRPLYVARLVAGLPFFVAYPLTLGSGYSEDVVSLLWTEPYEATFARPLGEPADEY